MPSVPVLVLGLAVCFLSPFPDSLPQLFLRCCPSALASGLPPSDPLPFVRFSSGSGYSASASSFPLFPALPHSGFPGAPFRFRFQAFPVLSGLISHAFLPGSRTRLPVCFLSSFPDSLPQPFLRCFPLALAFGLSPSGSLSFVRFPSGSGYSAFRSFLSLLPALPCRRFPRCFFLFRPACFHAFLPIPVLGLLQFLSPFAGSLHSSYPSASAFFLSSLPGLASQRLLRCALPLSLSGFPRSFQPGFPCLLPRFSYSAFCLFPFALP